MTRVSRRPLFVAASIAAAVVLGTTEPIALAVPSGAPAASCTSSPYAYAGLASNVSAQGIKATVTTLTAAQVPGGHVAGWIGVGGTKAGPNGQAEWLQTGVNTTAGGGTELYVETTRLGSSPTYKTLLSHVVLGTPYRLAVLELPGQPNVWQVWLNGKTATDPVSLPGSSRFAPMAMSESWNGGKQTCNGFVYRFDALRITTNPGSWRALTSASTLSDAGYLITDRTIDGFTAASA
jgi:hypothetical protein